jgi:hypothetical protein
MGICKFQWFFSKFFFVNLENVLKPFCCLLCFFFFGFYVTKVLKIEF